MRQLPVDCRASTQCMRNGHAHSLGSIQLSLRAFMVRTRRNRRCILRGTRWVPIGVAGGCMSDERQSGGRDACPMPQCRTPHDENQVT
jgi:hypothetical protein